MVFEDLLDQLVLVLDADRLEVLGRQLAGLALAEIDAEVLDIDVRSGRRVAVLRWTRELAGIARRVRHVERHAVPDLVLEADFVIELLIHVLLLRHAV